MSSLSKKTDWPIGNLTPYEHNAKKHGPEQVAKIAASIHKFGWQGNPIVVTEDGVIIAGHGRRLAAIELGMTHVPVVVARGLTEEQTRALRLADNRVAISDIDTELLKKDLDGLTELLGGIFDTKELDFMQADLGEMNTDAFVTDMDVVIADQQADMEQRVERAAEARISIAKAFGFKDLPASSQIHITRIMARAEAATGLKADEALVTYLAAL